MITVFANLLSYSNCVHVGGKIQKWFSLLVRSLLTGHLLIRDYKHLLEQALINSKFFVFLVVMYQVFLFRVLVSCMIVCRTLLKISSTRSVVFLAKYINEYEYEYISIGTP